MKRGGSLFAAFAAMAMLSACAEVYEPTPKVIPIHKAWIISDTAGLSHTIVRHKESDIRTCAEPAPDAAFDQSDTGNLNISLVSVGGSSQQDGAADAESSQEVELAGRTPAVLLSRELFFRTCEFSQNHELNKDEALKLFNRTLDIVEKNWATEAGQTTVTIGDTITTSQGATVQDTISQTESATTTTTDSSTDSSTDTTSESGSSSQ